MNVNHLSEIAQQDLEESMKKHCVLVDQKLDELIALQQPSILTEAAKYACNGGKKLRSFLVIECARLFSLDADLALTIAATLEMIHAYSLIHDDLPALDNDDYRRGQLSCHKKFDEASAILTGNALLIFAYETVSKESRLSYQQRCKLLEEISSTLGFNGMVYGQVLDIKAKNQPLLLEQIEQIHLLKTAKFLSVACYIGGVVGNASEADLIKLKEFGEHLGVIFQITDDLLDIDEKPNEECNILHVLSHKEIETLLDTHMTKALNALEGLAAKKIILLKSLLFFLKNRKT